MPQRAFEILRDLTLEAAWEEALAHYPALLLLDATNNSVRSVMKEAIEKALADGVTGADELMAAALAAASRQR